MRPPMMKRAVAEAENEAALSNPPATESKREGYAEKVKLARHLHEQGVNPLRWTEAHPAPQAAQREFQETGRKARDNQFEVGGRLYDWSPAVSASPEQAKAIADAYVATPHDPPAARSAPVESLIDVDKVPLKHPFGTPHAPRIVPPQPGSSQLDANADEERIALYRHYAKSGIDPNKAHLGDPLPMREQEKLKAEIAKLLPGDQTEISGLPMFYQGFDDGWIYTPNKFTQETPDVQKIRLAHAQKQIQPRDDRAPGASNDNDQAVGDEIVEHYNARDHADTPSPNVQLPKVSSDAERDALARQQLEEMSRWMPSLVSLVEKTQAGQALAPDETSLLAQVQQRFAEIDILFDPKKANLENLRETAKAIQHASSRKDSNIPLHLVALGINAGVAQSLANGTMDWARLGQIGWLEGLRQSLELLKSGRIRNAFGGLATAVNVTDSLITPKDDDMPDLLSITGEWAQSAIENILSSVKSDETADRMASAIDSAEQGQRQRELTPATPKTLAALSTGLAGVKVFEVLIGGIPLFKQSEHKTLIDEIFRTELIKIAQEKGCLPNPNDPNDRRKVEDFGGTKPQKRITDIDQDGHLGSRQPDGGLRWENHDGSWTEIMWNSTTPLANGFTEIVREWIALKDIIVKAGKHLNIGESAARGFTENPVLGKGPLYHMAEKPKWSEQELRDFISKKLRERFDKDFKDCKFIGESRSIKIDNPDDPDLPQTPAR